MQESRERRQAQEPYQEKWGADPLLGPLVLVDLAANVALFFLAGYLGFQATNAVRGGAEVGVIAGSLAGALAALRLAFSPLPEEFPPGAGELISLVALNVAGGVPGLLGGWLVRVARPQQ